MDKQKETQIDIEIHRQRGRRTEIQIYGQAARGQMAWVQMDRQTGGQAYPN
jgi:hypothetical protein